MMRHAKNCCLCCLWFFWDLDENLFTSKTQQRNKKFIGLLKNKKVSFYTIASEASNVFFQTKATSDIWIFAPKNVVILHTFGACTYFQTLFYGPILNKIIFIRMVKPFYIISFVGMIKIGQLNNWLSNFRRH